MKRSCFCFPLMAFMFFLPLMEVSNCRHTSRNAHALPRRNSVDKSRRDNFVDTSPLVVSQYTGKGVQNTKIQAPLYTEGVTRELKASPIDLSTDYLDNVPQDENKKAVASLLESLSGEKRWHTLTAHKEGRVDDVSRQLLAAANTAETSQQSSDDSDEKNEDDIAIKEGMLAHNSFRLLHHVQPLQWNESLAEQAHRIAKTIANDPSSFQGESPGENIAQIWHDFPHAPLKASNIWYSERKDYSFAYPKYKDKIRHFSQMIWKSTTQVGLGLGTSPSQKYKIVVALYWPMGNDYHPKALEANIPKPGGGPDVYATLKNNIIRPKTYSTPHHKRDYIRG